jgi:hypothetical protein
VFLHSLLLLYRPRLNANFISIQINNNIPTTTPTRLPTLALPPVPAYHRRRLHRCCRCARSYPFSPVGRDPAFLSPSRVQLQHPASQNIDIGEFQLCYRNRRPRKSLRGASCMSLMVHCDPRTQNLTLSSRTKCTSNRYGSNALLAKAMPTSVVRPRP